MINLINFYVSALCLLAAKLNLTSDLSGVPLKRSYWRKMNNENYKTKGQIKMWSRSVRFYVFYRTSQNYLCFNIRIRTEDKLDKICWRWSCQARDCASWWTLTCKINTGTIFWPWFHSIYTPRNQYLAHLARTMLRPLLLSDLS